MVSVSVPEESELLDSSSECGSLGGIELCSSSVYQVH